MCVCVGGAHGRGEDPGAPAAYQDPDARPIVAFKAWGPRVGDLHGAPDVAGRRREEIGEAREAGVSVGEPGGGEGGGEGEHVGARGAQLLHPLAHGALQRAQGEAQREETHSWKLNSSLLVASGSWNAKGSSGKHAGAMCGYIRGFQRWSGASSRSFLRKLPPRATGACAMFTASAP